VRIANAVDMEQQSASRSLLNKVFRRESPSTRTIAVLHLLDGLTHEEVAKVVGMSVSGVRKRLRLLRQHVHELQGAV
jgi:RNA polymerase sigma-70 factor (ECF subfamily)